MILAHWYSQIIQNTHTAKPLTGISSIGMEIIFSEIHFGSILGSNITEKISDVISWVEEEHEITSGKGFFKHAMSEK